MALRTRIAPRELLATPPVILELMIQMLKDEDDERRRQDLKAKLGAL